jgi:uncharacterized membrane protein YphA (DoxX/SURF4 family)
LVAAIVVGRLRMAALRTHRTRRYPLNTNRIAIGVATAAMLVILRLGLGFHFLYEGVWKIKNSEKFTAAPFLSEAKGPVAPLFYTMLPDLEGRQRLGIVPKGESFELAVETDGQGNVLYEELKDKDGKLVARWPKYKLSAYLSAWEDFKNKAKEFYKVTDEQARKIDTLYERYASSAREYVANNAEEILAHFESRQRFANAAGKNRAAHQQERDWARERELRNEVNGWLKELETLGKQFQAAVWNELDADQKAKGPAVSPWNLLAWSQMDLINFAVTYGLTAIGLCLVLGFFTRLAALGGAAFMAFVVMTQPAWPGLYPPDPPVVGHALLVNKDFVEMLALLVIATSLTGRWAGLDYFVHHLLVRPWFSKPSTPTTEGERR